MSRSIVSSVFLLLLLSGSLLAAAPQTSTPSNVLIKVTDSAGAPVSGARVTAQPVSPGAVVVATTDEHGVATVTIPQGAFTIAVSAAHFKSASRALTVGAASASVTMTLDLAEVRDAISVVADTGYRADMARSATKSLTPLHDTPQAVTVITSALVKDQMMTSVADVVRYTPGISAHQGENNRDQVIIRGNSSSADFFINGVRDDVQYYRDLYNLERIEALMGPNALMFGRGGGGGVINRVSKEAGFTPFREVDIQGGAYANGRATVDLNQPLTPHLSFRLNGMYEHSGSFRDDVNLRRHGINPTLTFAPSDRTRVVIRYENVQDDRVADRGITSFQGRPANVDVATYYGNPNDSNVHATVNLASATIDHRVGRVGLRNQTMVGDYDRGYQNFVPGAVNADASVVTLTAYNNATARTNVFNQTDVTAAVRTGRLAHALLGGAEFGRQSTDNFRNTGFFNNSTTSVLVPFGNPTITTPVTFRQAATDADNHVATNVAALYAQDHLDLTSRIKAVVGARVDRFDLTYHNNRNGDTLSRIDTLASPRAGVVVKATQQLSVYASYAVSFLPSSGDQFSSLTTITQQVKPERFNNYEGGVKWDARPGLSITSAFYRLDRTNTRATDPNDATRIVQTGSQRTNGFELGINGHVISRWAVAGGYAFQAATVTSATTAAALGARVGQVPRHTFSLWNTYRVSDKLSGAVGVIYRSEMFATIDDSVIVPGYTKVDLGAFYSLNDRFRVQMNLENVTNQKYFINADSNTNISPGMPRSVRFGLTTKF